MSAALSTGELLHSPGLTQGESKRLKVLQQRLARCKRGSNRRERTKRAIAKLKARERDRRKDWVEKSSADLARRFDVIRIEALEVRAMTRSARGTVDQPGVRVAQKRGLNRSISRSGWGQLVIRCSTKPMAESSKCGPRTRRYVAPRAGMSHPKTARAKRSSSAKPVLPDGATPTSTPHATSPPDGR
ncbi:MAG: putative transposase [Mycobacterium sp.]|nr:putative transposase [Mycobacterium sp.]